ncbi:MAG: hypothetical protein IK005_09710, partial [Paludibacteraceae bacterium]|nr:hypothetical protein [Paludibacteraceae bacterium]
LGWIQPIFFLLRTNPIIEISPNNFSTFPFPSFFQDFTNIFCAEAPFKPHKITHLIFSEEKAQNPFKFSP